MLLSISNLNRLGLINPYERFREGDMFEFKRENLAVWDSIPRDKENSFEFRRCELTDYGELFCKVCLE